MKKYCRYCAFCFCADDYRCSNHPNGKEVHWTEDQIKRETHCKNFVLCDLGCVINGRQYQPRDDLRKHRNNYVQFEQLSFI